MSGHRPWSEIRRGPSDERHFGALARGEPAEELGCPASDGDADCPECCGSGEAHPVELRHAREARACDMWNEHRALVADSVPSYEDLPERTPWLDRKGMRRDDFVD